MTQKRIDSNIRKAFLFIDEHLPMRYTTKVKKIVPTASVQNIRMVKKRKSGDPLIIAALKKVAADNKKMLE